MKINWQSSVLIFGIGFLLALGAAEAAATITPKISYVRGLPFSTSTPEAPQKPIVTHLPTPEPLKAIYMSQCVVGTESFRDSLVKFVEDTELNAIVIDIKDFSGGIAFPTENPILKPFVSADCGARDMRDFVASLHEMGIYAIARITVFQDPMYAKAHPELAVQKVGGGVWKNYGGLAFIDVGAKPFWDYIVELSKESYELGFDELNYDYIRYPSDGPMRQAVYSLSAGKSKEVALEEFFRYLHEKLEPIRSTSSGQVGVVTSADLFGYVTVHTDDLGIGQILERALPYFDFLAPMVYPSHYNAGFAGLKDVNSDPYKIVYASMHQAVARVLSTTTLNRSFDAIPIASTSPQLYEKKSYPASAMRPWLQSFDYPVPYTAAMVAAQIKANEDAGLDSYMFWDAANKYRSLRAVLKKE
ncbi:hypothetical protein A2763_02145 [Candidatus Kaiserbacteria bacterium RIFCSPHIGHO2_01_FULL_54_36]|uniref:DUF4015 domain-containing protein n=1 Tax=Candidatus Kaiserbacteria bacterium RIFCSPHIGHO2_01_FULL_54_36 TaxID=1798482 RepID=A0A1F6CPU7_9BACT|nr:MAG: hypothetical protein A2763_02145 [Candidatus Kaiserbacteria bacterium RIFCSPHIGHO2_01_FULL_54_36]OGG75909.1 MAG: hypothetical protein A3A41_04615 [Candidatus Kaiserbacteria bacterium RIFCSPLOWO2_01_FULL_54_22]